MHPIVTTYDNTTRIPMFSSCQHTLWEGVWVSPSSSINKDLISGLGKDFNPHYPFVVWERRYDKEDEDLKPFLHKS